MTPSNELVQQMRAAAEKATPGPWFRSGVRFTMNGQQWHNVLCYDTAKKTDEHVACVGYNPRTGEGIQDADYIAAANPTNVLALIAALEAANARAEKAERERDEAEKATRVVQNAAKTIASAHGTELEHRRQNATYDHRLRAEHESLKTLNSQLTEMHEAANARADAAEAKVGRLTAAVEYADGCFEAALCEGWLEALGEGEMERLRDIWERRISFARDLFPAALASEAS